MERVARTSHGEKETYSTSKLWAVAIIDVEDDTSGYNIPGGAEAQVAVYTPFAHHFAIIRRILLRMKSWQNFVFLEGH